MPVVINPGTGPVADATEENAIENMEQFVLDSICADSFARDPGSDWNDGRFSFRVFYAVFPDKYIDVQMPGLPLEQVRYMSAEYQNPWHFPRLYVDGSSWLWYYALIDHIWDWS